DRLVGALLLLLDLLVRRLEARLDREDRDRDGVGPPGRLLHEPVEALRDRRVVALHAALEESEESERRRPLEVRRLGVADRLLAAGLLLDGEGAVGRLPGLEPLDALRDRRLDLLGVE